MEALTHEINVTMTLLRYLFASCEIGADNFQFPMNAARKSQKQTGKNSNGVQKIYCVTKKYPEISSKFAKYSLNYQYVLYCLFALIV